SAKSLCVRRRFPRPHAIFDSISFARVRTGKSSISVVARSSPGSGNLTSLSVPAQSSASKNLTALSSAFQASFPISSASRKAGEPSAFCERRLNLRRGIHRMAEAITSRNKDYSQWYLDIVKHAQMAENSDVRGCMVIKPHGYAIWERMQRALDGMFKDTGHVNAYFPLFIPRHFLEKEAEHVEGFAKECAVVTHHRLIAGPDGKGLVPDPASKLEEELIIRPTSETIIWNTYKNWVQSYRDLPILLNQWCNVVRWEMRTRLFLRTTEFLWQEGHTVHETEAEAREETQRMLGVYETFARDHCAIPAFAGEKSESEKFPGAVQTMTIEAMVQDRKAIQAGTSHFLGQNFARASGIQFQNREGKQEFGWTTSWGMTARLVGTVVMMHGDDDGIILPPRIAPTQIVILPVT